MVEYTADHVPLSAMNYLKFREDPKRDRFVSHHFSESYNQMRSFKQGLKHKPDLKKRLEFDLYQALKRQNKPTQNGNIITDDHKATYN
jgi:hypothetical protein